MDIPDRLAKERRARLAAERLLQMKSRELFAVNEKLALHARNLFDQVVEQREVTRSALSETEVLKGQKERFVTDLDRAHTAAVIAERRLWESIDSIRDGFAVFDHDLRLIAANVAFREVFSSVDASEGVYYSELLKLAGDAGLFDIGHTSVRDWATDMLVRVEQDFSNPAVLHLQTGQWLQLSDRRTRDGDVVILLQDVTEQMRMKVAIEAIPDGFVLFDRDERLIMANSTYRDAVPEVRDVAQPGARLEDILRTGLDSGAFLDGVGREEAWLAERLAHHRNAEGELTIQTATGRWLRKMDRPTPDGGRVSLSVDVTELKAQTAALEAARAAAEAANRAKSAFLANMSHEIRTPMNGVVGMAELLCETNLTEEQRLFTETIKSSGEALLVIINDILDYSKIEAERLTLHPEPFDLERTVHEVVMLLQPKARAKGLDLMIDFDMFLPTRFVGDPGRTRQVLTNLIGNAVKFTETGHVLIRVVGIEDAPGHQQLHVTVEDTGIGIAPENLGHVFGEFNQVESAANRKFEGTGLGLAITQKLIERMGGEVWVDSEIGRGSSFGFRVPLAVAEEARTPEVPVSVRRALVVDDQFINRTILERQLVPCGIEVALCRSGADALALLAQGQQFDVVLTDHHMPDMDGLVLATRIRDGGWTMPVLLLTSSPVDVRDAPVGLLTAVVQKPVLRADLYRRLNALSAPVLAQVAPVAAPAVSTKRAMRVLAAEDNRTNQLVFRKMVQDSGIDLTFANNGREAVELFQSLDPDMIFMDISMPEMDGREASKAIRALEVATGGHIPIVALTAHAMDGDDADILAAGIDHYMTKPLRKAAIVEVLVQHCPADAQGIILLDAVAVAS
jgi:signal transduction histidine kinase/DNA-binding response OmpR family regulator